MGRGAVIRADNFLLTQFARSLSPRHSLSLQSIFARPNFMHSDKLRRSPGAKHQQVPHLYYSWSKEFLEAGKRRLAGDTARSATTSEVKDLKRQALELKEVVAEQALELRLLKKSMTGDGEDEA
jgi:hypothetical protein